MNIILKCSLMEESSKFVFRIMYWHVVKTGQCFQISEIRRSDINRSYFMRQGFFFFYLIFLDKVPWDLN